MILEHDGNICEIDGLSANKWGYKYTVISLSKHKNHCYDDWFVFFKIHKNVMCIYIYICIDTIYDILVRRNIVTSLTRT